MIASISGAAVAGGMELALWCDLRVMEADAYFGVFCRRFGVPLIDGGTVRLPRLIGMCLCNRVVPSGEALPAALALAQQLAAFPQSTLLADRASAYTQWDLDLPHALHQEWQRGKACIAEGRVGMGNFSQIGL